MSNSSERREKVIVEKYKIWPCNFHYSRMCVGCGEEKRENKQQKFTRDFRFIWLSRCLMERARREKSKLQARKFSDSNYYRILGGWWISLEFFATKNDESDFYRRENVVCSEIQGRFKQISRGYITSLVSCWFFLLSKAIKISLDVLVGS